MFRGSWSFAHSLLSFSVFFFTATSTLVNFWSLFWAREEKTWRHPASRAAGAALQVGARGEEGGSGGDAGRSDVRLRLSQRLVPFVQGLRVSHGGVAAAAAAAAAAGGRGSSVPK